MLKNSSTEQPQLSPPAPIMLPSSRSRRTTIIILCIIIAALLAIIAAGLWYLNHQTTQQKTASNTAATSSVNEANTSTTQGLQLDTGKNYGDKYADGVLPVGDGKYVTDTPKQGYVYACSQYAQNLATDTGGAQTRGPWFTNNNTEYDLAKKLHVQGNVMWQADFSNTLSGSTRTIVTNDLPAHATGIFPISSTDPAYQYDRNPNTIKSQTYTFALAASPSYSSTPNCIGGVVGIMLTGVELFSAFDAGGRDAGAWEIQDSCNGHPEKTGAYHYHTLSSCIKNIGVQTVIGFALDGFPITGPQVGSDNVLTSNDLDECHGITSQITLDGKPVTTYHYVMTEDFPYSVSCYRSAAIQPPGLSGSDSSKQQPQQGQLPRP